MGWDMGKVGMILEINVWVVMIRGRGKLLEVMLVNKYKDIFFVDDYREGSFGVDYMERCISDML